MMEEARVRVTMPMTLQVATLVVRQGIMQVVAHVTAQATMWVLPRVLAQIPGNAMPALSTL